MSPVINSFTESYVNGIANLMLTDLGAQNTTDSLSTFYWSAENATRYEIYSPAGLIYSGTANRFTVPQGTRVVNGYAEWLNFTLRAWNGSAYKDSSVRVSNSPEYDPCGGNCSGS